MYKGDIGLVRKCIADAGLFVSRYASAYNDNSSHNNKRRIKITRMDNLFNASHAQQVKLDKLLRETFGERFLTAYFIQSGAWRGNSKDFCIKLQDL